MNRTAKSPPATFKGIALFTPGGDLVYCIDPHKQVRWHVHLCGMLQHLFDLPEPPHFLVPCYSATVDRTVHPQSRQSQDLAEASLRVLRYQPLLNAVFGTEGLIWQPAPAQRELCDLMVLDTYRAQFPQLWQSHDLVVRYEQTPPPEPYRLPFAEVVSVSPLEIAADRGYVLRLFVSGYSMATERTLQKVHYLLEQVLEHPYTLKVIDVSQHPEEAELNQVTATPTLVRVYPRPVHRIVGDLDNADQLLGVLRFADE